MDPSFTTNLIIAGNQAVNVTSTLLGLLFASSLLYAFLQIIFDLPLYNIFFGKGTKQSDGTYDWQSKFFPNCDPRPYLAAGAGIVAAFLFGLQAWAFGLSMDITLMSEEAKWFDKVITGVTISAGCKGVIYFVNEYKKGKAAIKDLEG